MNKTNEIRGSLVDSAANWDSMGKTKLLKLAEAAAASVPQTEWGMQMSALEDRVNNVVQNDANNQTRIIKGTNLGDEMDMVITLQTQHYPGLPRLRALIRGEFLVRGGTNYPIGDAGAGIAIRSSESVNNPSIWFKWEEIGGSEIGHYSVLYGQSDLTAGAFVGRDPYAFGTARLSFLCSFYVPADSGVTIWPEFITANSAEVEDMFIPSSYIQSTVQLDSIVA